MKQRPNISTTDFDLFHDISTFIHDTLDLDEMLHRIFDRIKGAFNIEGASIALHDPDRQEFFFIHTVEMDSSKSTVNLRRMRFPDHLGVAGWVWRNDRPAIINDVSKENRFFKGIDLQQKFVTRNMICLPLRTRRGTIGVLYALNKLEGEFTDKEAWMLESLASTIAIAIENANLYGELKDHAGSLEHENRRLKTADKERYKLQGIIGSSRAMQHVFHLLDKVLNSSTAVLLLGETGTGKELVARIIHHNGPRKNNPFIVENCAALSEHLLESELFGHVKGAFTGAMADKKGLFELATGGTVFLDEIGEIPAGMQVKLLRVLQDGKIRPVGGSNLVQVDFRLISATNRNLDEEVQAGRFREDLFYRINVFPIVLPPLRERSEDIPLLVDHFLHKHSKKMNRPVKQITPLALELLLHYQWPGNIRELENEIERAVTLAAGVQNIGEEHLSEKITAENFSQPLPKVPGETLRAYIERIEKRWIGEALEETQGNRTRAAKMLGLTRQGLLKKIARYDIPL
jgi:Nif-specific regulatory protein